MSWRRIPFAPVRAWKAAGLAVLLLSPASQANAQSDSASFSSVPKDRTSYWRQAVPEDFTAAAKLKVPMGSAPAAVVYVCDVVVSNTDQTLNANDFFGDEEPSIAINPANTNEIVILAFSGSWGGTAPMWHSTNGGLIWTKSFTIPRPTGLSVFGPEDQAPDYGRNNQMAAVFLATDTNFNTDVYAGVTTDPATTASFNWPLVGGVAVSADFAAPGNNDQPWLLVNSDPINPNQDNVYVAYDDFGGSPDMRVVVSPGISPLSFTADKLVGFSTGSINPGQRLAKDSRTGYIYSLFQRNIAPGAGGSKNINYMLNRSVDGGQTWTLNGSPTGVIVANGDSTQPTPKFGTVNALLGGVDHAAVDPNNSDVYYVYGRRDGATGNNRLALRRLTDNGAGGLSIGPEVFVTDQVQAALPSVAVTTSGVVGVLYDTFDGLSGGNFPIFSAHLAVSLDHGTNFSDTVLYTFLSSATDNASDSRQRVLGDYQQMKAVGPTFYGVFTANGLQLGRPFANHDPIFFKATVGVVPTIVAQPADQTAFEGDAASFTVTAAGIPPLSFQWQFNGVPLTGATAATLLLPNVTPSQAGAYSVTVNGPLGSTLSSSATLTVLPTVPLPIALNATNLPWITDGDVNWHGLTNISHDGIAAGQSGHISDGQASRLTTTTNGPGKLTFWWKVSSQTNADILSFVASGIGQSTTLQISGEVDWNQQTIFLPPGPQTFQWTYTKDATKSAGSDAGWVDQVGLVPGFTLPFIISQPLGKSSFAGSPVTFTVAANGTPALSYQWRLNGTDIPGATSTSFAIANPTVLDSGLYSVRVTNSFGGINSANASLAIVPLVVRGDNAFGQVNVSLNTATAVGIAAGAWHSLILLSDGSVLANGEDYDGQCDVPGGLTGVMTVAAGGYHSLALKFDGTVAGWGANYNGEAAPPAGLSNVIAIAAGTWHSLALRADGTVTAWGDNSLDQCSVPSGLANVTAIAAGGSHSLALRADGTVVAWGENTDANGNFIGQSMVPYGLANVAAIGAGDYHSLAVKADGSIVTWGDDSQGQLDAPLGLSHTVGIVGGSGHTVALRSDSTVAAWGIDWNGQIDLPAGLSNIVAIAAGNAHTLLLEGNSLALPQLMRPTHLGNQFRIAVQTFAGKTYALEYKTSLTDAVWTPAASIHGNGAMQFLLDPNATGPRRFYRVREY